MVSQSLGRKLNRMVRKSPWVQWWRRRGYPQRSFELAGHRFPYFVHRRNYTWMNERAVEVPVVWHALMQRLGQRTLEVGNVMSQYYPTDHTVVDKYERAAGVINRDIVDFQDDVRYDLIISISTLEHVGWDESPRDPRKIVRAVDRMIELLRPGGHLLVTLPLGYNPHLDALLDEGALPFHQQRYLLRVSADNRWEERPWDDVRGSRYGTPYDCANALVVGTYDKAA